MADSNLALKDLQAKFPGQFLLSPSNIAEVLLTTPKAIAHRITRNRLPFQVKRVGNKRYADIYQVAEWLASGRVDDEVHAPAAAPATIPAPASAVLLAAATSSMKRPSTRKPKAPRPGEGRMTALLMQMGNEISAAFARFAAGLADPEERGFMSEIAELMAFAPQHLDTEFVATVVQREFSAGASVQTEAKAHFDDVEAAQSFLTRVRSAPYDESASVRVVLKHGRKVLHHSFLVGGTWHLVKGAAKLIRPAPGQGASGESALFELPADWLAAQRPGVQRELKCFLKAQPDDHAVFLAALCRHLPLIPRTGLVVPLHEIWCFVPGVLSFSLATRLQSPGELISYLNVTERALLGDAEVTEFESCFRPEDPLAEVLSWLRGKAYQNDLLVIEAGLPNSRVR